MKRILFGMVVGLFLGWLTVPLVKASYFIDQSDKTVVNDDDDFRASHAYKWYLTQMLRMMKEVDTHLASIDENMRLVKEKLHA